MTLSTNLEAETLLREAEPSLVDGTKFSKQAVIDGVPEQETNHNTGILPSQELSRLVRVTKEIVALEEINDDQIQPASMDLRLGAIAYRVRASFLPGKDHTVRQRLDDLAMHEMDITNGGVLERGCVYIVPLMENLSLRHRTSATGNPKSSTGRLDIFTRLITDFGTQLDRKSTRLNSSHT